MICLLLCTWTAKAQRDTGLWLREHLRACSPVSPKPAGMKMQLQGTAVPIPKQLTHGQCRDVLGQCHHGAGATRPSATPHPSMDTSLSRCGQVESKQMTQLELGDITGL